MSYKFDEKMKEGLKRGDKLFNKVPRERFVVENAEEDLQEYYEKTQKTSLGLEKGKKMFHNSGSYIYTCQDCLFSTINLQSSLEHEDNRDHTVLRIENEKKNAGTVHFTFGSGTERQAVCGAGVAFSDKHAKLSDVTCKACLADLSGEKKNADKSYMPNGCSGPNGCSAKMMKNRSIPAQCGNVLGQSHDWEHIVQGAGQMSDKCRRCGVQTQPYSRRNADTRKCPQCGAEAEKVPSARSEKGVSDYECPSAHRFVVRQNNDLTSSDGEAGSSHLSNREGKNEDGFRGEVGLDNAPKTKCEACSKRGHDSVRDWEDCTWGDCECPCQSDEKANGLAPATQKKCPVCDGPVVPTEGVSGSNNQYTCKRCAQDFDTTELKNSFTNCAGACGCSEASHKPNAPERCGCSCAECEQKKHQYALENASDCEECGHPLRSHNAMGCKDCGEGCTCGLKENAEQSEYPHDILPNSKGGLKIGQSKYGTK